RPGDRMGRDDDRGLARHAGGARLAVPPAGERGGAPAAADRAGARRALGRARRSLRTRAGTLGSALKLAAIRMRETPLHDATAPPGRRLAPGRERSRRLTPAAPFAYPGPSDRSQEEAHECPPPTSRRD